MNCKNIFAGLIASFATLSCYGQTPASYKPFAGEDAVTGRLFNLPAGEANFCFTAALPGGNFVIIECSHVSDWQPGGGLAQIASLAALYEQQVADSFHEAVTAKRLDIHVPIATDPVTVMITEHKSEKNVLLIRGAKQAPLKVNMDTIRVLRTLAEHGDGPNRTLAQIQYTFLLKDIADIGSIDKAALAADVAPKFDSVISKYHHRWSNPDKWSHDLSVVYNPEAGNPKQRLTVARRDDDDENLRFYHAFTADYGMGLTLYRNSPCPLLDLGLSWMWPSHAMRYSFVRLSANAFSDFLWPSPTDYKTYSIMFVNLEIGGIGRRTGEISSKVYGASMGIGIRIPTPDNVSYEPLLPTSDPTIPNDYYHFFVSFRTSKKIKLTMDIYGNYAFSSNKAPGVISLSGTYRLL